MRGAWVHWYRGAWVHGSKGTGVRGCTGTGVQWFMGALVQGYMGAQVLGCTGTGVHGCTGTRMHGSVGTWVHRYTGTRVQGYMGAQVQGYVGAQTPFSQPRSHFGCSFLAGSRADQVTALRPAKHILQNCPHFGPWGPAREELDRGRAGRAARGSAADRSQAWGTQTCTHPYAHKLALPRVALIN